MTVYLGSQGVIELKRKSALTDTFTVSNNSINVADKRIEFGFPHGQYMTGDEIQIKSIKTNAPLAFLTATPTARVKVFFFHVDDASGVHLYDNLPDALNDNRNAAIALKKPGGPVKVELKQASEDHRVLAQVTSYELNTQRETVDTTALAEEFRSRVNTLISGSGRMTAFWDYLGEDETTEMPNYIVELAIRTKVGSNFDANFILKRPGYMPSNDPAHFNDSVFYAFEGIITACAVQFTTGNAVQVTADFVTTGKIDLKMNLFQPGAILQENESFIMLNRKAPGEAKLMTEFE